MAQLVYICTLCIKYSSYIALDRLGKKEKSLQLINLFKLVSQTRRTQMDEGKPGLLKQVIW